MIRTRDFVLFLTCVAFLVVAIGFEFIGVWSKGSPFDIGQSAPEFVGGEGSILTAELPPVVDERPDRIARLREVIRGMVAPEPIAVVDDMPAEEATSTEETRPLAAADQCNNYQEYTKSWSAAGLQVVEREGVRIFHEPVIGSTTDDLGVVRVILPIREFKAASASCLSTDVVGIALDGSLIRNNEQGVYGVFGESSQIGYALDGFPIYGVSADATDECGGTATPAGYRYYLSADRDYILGCFAAVPTAL